MRASYFLFLLLFLPIGRLLLAQISPPGLGEAHTADWFAIGLRQKFDSVQDGGWQSMSYIGLGRKSNPNNYNPFFKSAIWVVNQEFYCQVQHWQLSLALSYRRQDEYADRTPYAHENPATKQEFRLSSRLSYAFSKGRIKFVPTLRQEFRKFYAPDFHNTSENYQLRTRFRWQLAMIIDRSKRHKITTSAEQLFSISKKTNPRAWTNFGYRESRLALYYSYSPKFLPLVFSVGYMGNIVGWAQLHVVHHFAFDIVVENPFGSLRRHKGK